MQEQSQTEEASRPEEEEGEKPQPRFVIDVDHAMSQNRSLPLMILGRMGYTSRQMFDESPSPSDKVKPYIARIVEHDSKEADYLLPDTPLKEAIFRVLLASGNQPMTAEEISEILSEKWAMTAYPRDLSPGVIQRLLEHGESYCIAQLLAPEDEE